MTSRDLKLAIACENECEEVKSLNNFFEDLFSDILLYTDNNNDIYYVKNELIILEFATTSYDTQLWCDYNFLWKILETKYICNRVDIIDIIRYKVDVFFNIKNISYVEKCYQYQDINNLLLINTV